MTAQLAIRIPWHGHMPRQDILQVLQIADDAGFHSAWLGDHIVYPLETSSRNETAPAGVYAPAAMAAPTYEALTLLAFAAAASTRIKLGVGCLVLPQRHPLIVAKEAATIDQLSEGRLLLGVVGGWLEEEFQALDVPFPERRGRLEEGVALLRHCWETEQPSWEGRYWSFPPLQFVPKPRQAPLPVWFGGHSRTALQRAALLGDGWYGSRLSAEQAARRVRAVREYRQQSPRQVHSFTVMISAPTPPPGTPYQPTPSSIKGVISEYEDAGADVVLFDTNVLDSGSVVALAEVAARALG
jgi:probable F420-dependent oxidoreductase